MLLFATMVSCDPDVYHDFYIKNSCEESIEVELLHYDGSTYPASLLTANFVIECGECKLIGAKSTIAAHDDIRYYFKSLSNDKNKNLSIPVCIS